MGAWEWVDLGICIGTCSVFLVAAIGFAVAIIVDKLRYADPERRFMTGVAEEWVRQQVKAMYALVERKPIVYPTLIEGTGRKYGPGQADMKTGREVMDYYGSPLDSRIPT